jgi:transposase
VLVPRLEPGHVIVLDNLGAHKVEGARQLVESRGAHLLYLSPLLARLQSHRAAWSKLKQLLRGVKARLLQQLEPAIAQSLTAITPQNARAFFRHCGYGI